MCDWARVRTRWLQRVRYAALTAMLDLAFIHPLLSVCVSGDMSIGPYSITNFTNGTRHLATIESNYSSVSLKGSPIHLKHPATDNDHRPQTQCTV